MLELTDLKHEMQLMHLSGSIMQTVIKTVEFTDCNPLDIPISDAGSHFFCIFFFLDTVLHALAYNNASMCFNSNIASSFTSKNFMLARKSILTSEITETMKVLENVFQIQQKDIWI